VKKEKVAELPSQPLVASIVLAMAARNGKKTAFFHAFLVLRASLIPGHSRRTTSSAWRDRKKTIKSRFSQLAPIFLAPVLKRKRPWGLFPVPRILDNSRRLARFLAGNRLSLGFLSLFMRSVRDASSSEEHWRTYSARSSSEANSRTSFERAASPNRRIPRKLRDRYNHY